MWRMVVALVIVAVASACGSSTGPSNGPLTGTWAISAPSLTTGSAACSFSGTMTITQSGSSLHGDLPQPGITTVCVDGDTKDSVTDAGTGLASGSVSGSSVSLSLDNNNAVQASGTFSGSTMSGNSMTINYPPNIVNATGAWSATKQ